MVSEKKYITFSTLIAAQNGDTVALKEILNFYTPIIRKLAQVNVFDSLGQKYTVVDEDLCRELEIKLIVATMNFTIKEE